MIRHMRVDFQPTINICLPENGTQRMRVITESYIPTAKLRFINPRIQGVTAYISVQPYEFFSDSIVLEGVAEQVLPQSYRAIHKRGELFDVSDESLNKSI